ncbi:MAG: NAD-dependent epimerase/dehydratase family protein [Candidatus Binatia bacterium]
MTDAGWVRTRDLDYIVDRLAGEFPSLDGRHLLITGGGGFLGYYLVQSALHWNNHRAREPVRITLIYNFQRGVPDWISGLGAGVALVSHNVTEPFPADIEAVDYLIHAAGIASPGLYRRIPIETMDANVGGLRRLLDYSVRQAEDGHPLSGFLFYSSSEIYGDPVASAIPTPESYRGNVSCTGPRACYDESKRFGETLSVNFARVYGLPVTIARPFNNYGPGMKINDGRVIADFARAVISDETIVILSDGSPTRTFCYVADAIVGYFKVLFRGRPGEPYNIGTEGPEISMSDLAGLMAKLGRELFGYAEDVRLGISQEADYLIDNPNRRCPDLTKARSELGYRPEVGLEEGLRRTLLWYRANSVPVGA